MPAVKTVRWSPEAPTGLKQRFGKGPFKVLKVLISTSNCAPGVHYHITVKAPRHPLKQGTFCSRLFQPASPPGPPVSAAGVRRRRRRAEHRELSSSK